MVRISGSHPEGPGSIPGNGMYFYCIAYQNDNVAKRLGLVRELNPGPPAPEAGIIPLDQQASIESY